MSRQLHAPAALYKGMEPPKSLSEYFGGAVNLLTCRQSNPGPLSPQPSHSTNYTVYEKEERHALCLF
jgi:hypothetical protein